MTDPVPQFSRQLHIDAPPDVVFAYFTDPRRMAEWMGIGHRLEAVPGGTFMVDINGRDVAEGTFVEVDPPRRLVFTWGWRNSLRLPPGATTVEVNLSPDGIGTLLDFTHHGVPASPEDRHTDGWNHYMARLALVAAGRPAGPDTFAAIDR
jgi:uncharacterized protein YndB with AHSA1/START domain